MKKALLYTLFVSILFSCSTRKRVETAVNSGNYNQAITTALSKLRKNKDKKRNQDYVIVLHDAYHKVVERDLNTIEHLKKDNNPETFKDIFEMYVDLDARQEAIKPLLPLYANGKKITFKFKNYSNDILVSKNKLSDYLYEKGLDLLESDDKHIIRNAHSELAYLDRISPNYENTRELLNEALERGKDYVLVSINNATEQVIPARLEEELLNFNTYGLNKFWSEYHAIAQPNRKYDFAMHLNLRQINISPERINQREFLREREISDGWEYEKDRNGNVLKDSLGNDIKYEKFINVRARLYETIQTKSVQVVGDVVYLDNNTQQTLDTFTIDSGFIFEHISARFRGDRRALLPEDRQLLNNRQLPFPSNEQMIFDTGEDLKVRLKQIINSYSVTRL
ncbi:hypothetical protein SAMN05421824_2032 [Hyunsoonleella jejuensis]|uniref:Lipoprotein n=1 Tax=Hyunsoonleella jejuensis TaxID=419940 RepID=A0A1H9H7I4_9FLAO|nr:hypothetical protein [Hyunsoonleella jejuensis]SEQ58285.1 hypothetical protein SAMN05421824_2032 [Hyunsoonleella jejuensis]